MPNNYRPISKLSALAKVFESLISEQVKEYRTTQSILCRHQSGFRKNHSTTTAATKVINDIAKALDDKKQCVSLFIDLSKAYNTVDHNTLVKRLVDIGMSQHSVVWFCNYLTERTQAMQFLCRRHNYLLLWGYYKECI